MDMLKAVIAVGIINRNQFKNVLKLTLIKNSDDIEKFDEVFDLFWGKETETKRRRKQPFILLTCPFRLEFMQPLP